MLDPASKADLEKVIARDNDPSPKSQAIAKRYDALIAKEQQFEREFYAAGGLLTTGPDPTGSGHVLAGFGDQRAIESLVEGGFTPLEAIHSLKTGRKLRAFGDDACGQHFGRETSAQELHAAAGCEWSQIVESVLEKRR